MRIALMYLLFIVCFDVALGAMETLCENMDVPDKEKMAREACHGMCLLHNCGGGECVAHGGWKYCACTSCKDFDNADMELERIVRAYWYY